MYLCDEMFKIQTCAAKACDKTLLGILMYV